VGVAFVAEEDVATGDVFVLVGGVCGVPVVAGEFVVGAGEEVVALGVVLADEEDEGWLGAFAEFGVAPPPGEVVVVAAELVVVLVGAAGAVVFDQEEPWAVRAIVGDLECGVGDDRPWLGVAQPFDGAVVAEAQLGLAGGPAWGDLVLAVPFE
jgi:hypothetical protein